MNQTKTLATTKTQKIINKNFLSNSSFSLYFHFFSFSQGKSAQVYRIRMIFFEEKS